MAKNGLSVVAAMRMTVPFSTSARSTSCWARLKRWSSSTKSTVRRPRPAIRRCAAAMTSRTSCTLLAAALTDCQCACVARATRCASALFPVPGGP